jgi:hypothetical protein
MQRREYLAGGAGLAALLAGGAYVTLGDRRGPERLQATEVRTLGVEGAAPATITVPVPDTYTVLDIFSYGCGECQKQMGTLETARAALGDAAQFVSIHPSYMVDDPADPEPVLDFWANHGSDWPLAMDPGDYFYEAFEKPAFPFTAVIDPDNRVLWSATGVTGPGPIERAVEGGD